MAAYRFNVNGIADELQALPRWVRFDLERTTRGKLRKTPYIPHTRFEASNRNPAHWCPFDVAVGDAVARGQYVGFVFDRSLPYVFIDKDDALGAHGVLRASAARIVDMLHGRTERSAGGAGVHIVVRGTLPERFKIAPDLKPIEIYPRRGPRFCVFTGDLLPVEGNLESAIPDRAAELAALFPALPPRAITGTVEGYNRTDGALSDAEIAGIVAWATPFWTDGRRHHLALYLTGELCRQGVSRTQAVAIIEQCSAQDSDPGGKVSACHNTYDDAEAGADISGWYGLKDACGLTGDELAPLTALLDSFWQRTRPRMLRVRRAPKLLVRGAAHA